MVTRREWPLAAGERFSWSNGNTKTGRMLVTRSSAITCPPSCPFIGAGCYGEASQSGTRVWREISGGSDGVSLSDLCDRIRAVPAGSLWRMNETGDLPGVGNRIRMSSLRRITKANSGRRGFTYTHKTLTPRNVSAIREANADDFVVNLSADNRADAVRKLDANCAPVVLVVPLGTPRMTRLDNDVRVLRCPAERSDKTCLDCGWCARPNRDFVVGFGAHGVRKRMVSEMVGSE